MKSMVDTYQAKIKLNWFNAQLGATGIHDEDDDDFNPSQLLSSQDKIMDFLREARL